MNAPTSVPTFENQRASGQNILLPSTGKGRIRRSVLLEVNSRDRNIRSYPTATEFRWKLFRPLKDVLSIQIVGGTVPTRFFNIDSGWNKFTFFELSTHYTITLTPGCYTTAQMVSELAARFNDISGTTTNKYTFSISPVTDCITMTRTTSNKNFSLLFGSGDYVDLYDNNSLIFDLFYIHFLHNCNCDFDFMQEKAWRWGRSIYREFIFLRVRQSQNK
jgi:hypothetical protein